MCLGFYEPLYKEIKVIAYFKKRAMPKQKNA